MKILKKNIKVIIAFVIGAILFGSIGVVVATNIASSTVWYETSKNANVETVEDALDDLYAQIIGYPVECYNGVCGKLSYRYWNNNFTFEYNYDTNESIGMFASNSIPTITYGNRALLAQYYGASNFNSRPYYIRSVQIDGLTVGHQVCLWYNNKEFCYSPGYWTGIIDDDDDETAGIQTKIRLQRDLQESLGITINNSNCRSGSGYANCSIGSFSIHANYNGVINVSDEYAYCIVSFDGVALCDEIEVWN